MLRKLSFTDRAKLARSHVHVALRREADGTLAFDPMLSLEGVAAHADARVFIEAYHRTSFMRFDCGSVGDFAPPNDRRLTDIEGTSVRFRVKIVEGHRIVAVADDIRVTERQPDASGRTPLLPVQFTDALGQQAWRVSFEPDTPVLELNNRIPEIEKLAKDDALFFALVYPAAVRSILTQILLVDGHDSFDDSTEWWSLWMRWSMRHAPSAAPADTQEAAQWIEEVVSSFASHHQLIERINAGGAE